MILEILSTWSPLNSCQSGLVESQGTPHTHPPLRAGKFFQYSKSRSFALPILKTKLLRYINWTVRSGLVLMIFKSWWDLDNSQPYIEVLCFKWKKKHMPKKKTSRYDTFLLICTIQPKWAIQANKYWKFTSVLGTENKNRPQIRHVPGERKDREGHKCSVSKKTG